MAHPTGKTILLWLSGVLLGIALGVVLMWATADRSAAPSNAEAATLATEFEEQYPSETVLRVLTSIQRWAASRKKQRPCSVSGPGDVRR